MHTFERFKKYYKKWLAYHIFLYYYICRSLMVRNGQPFQPPVPLVSGHNIWTQARVLLKLVHFCTHYICLALTPRQTEALWE